MKIQIKRRLLSNLIVVIVALAFFSYSVLAITQLISLQGKITYNGALVDDGNLTVTIWDAATGDGLIYNSSHYFNDSIQNGFFDVMLGSWVRLDLNLSQTYYMDIMVNEVDLDKGGNERIEFQSPVGFDISGNENFTVDTNVLYVDTENNKVGIGTSTPDELIELRDVSGATAQVGIKMTTTSDRSFIGWGLGGTGGTFIRGLENSPLYLGVDNSNDLTINTGGNVGIATTDHQKTLHVVGTFNATETTGGASISTDTSGNVYIQLG